MKALVYAAVDPNLIDGSSVWLASLAQCLSRVPGMAVHVLLRKPLKRELILGPVGQRDNVCIVDPFARRCPGMFARITGNRALSASSAAEIIRALHLDESYDVIIIRDEETAENLLPFPEVAAKLWVYLCDPLRLNPSEQRRRTRSLVDGARRLLCQTEAAREALLRTLDRLPSAEIVLLPPMIPDFTPPQYRRFNKHEPRLAYCGKFSPGYRAIEMLQAFREIRRQFRCAEFHLVGDKFHNSPPVKGFEKTLRELLTKQPGVHWHGGLPRREALKVLGQAHLATSWRTPAFDNSVELSTKVLEYGAAGLPILLNRNPFQEALLGQEYPAFVATKQDFVRAFRLLALSERHYKMAFDRAVSAAARFTFSQVSQDLSREIRKTVRPEKKRRLSLVNERRRVLFAGHNLHFIVPFIEELQVDTGWMVSKDQWRGHATHSEELSRRALKESEIIFCEWCLGNAVWYSRHKKDGQKLVVRLHHQELNLPYLDQLEWDAVNALIVICPQHLEELRQRYPEHARRILLVFNPVPTRAFSQPKLPGSDFNLGFMGMVPMRKRLDLALDILEALRRCDRRYNLFVSGKGPDEYSWMRKRFRERFYFHRLFQRIASPELAFNVVFDGHQGDVPLWFRKLGFLLSTSDHEGSHQAVAEAMAAGSIPIVRNWRGSDQIYPSDLIFSSVEEAVALILRLHKSGEYERASKRAQDYARSRFDEKIINAELKRILRGKHPARSINAVANEATFGK